MTFAVATAALVVPAARRWGVVGLSAAALVFTFYLLDRFMPAVAPSWSQKGPIAAYYRERRSPEERLIAYQLYWRGETFYTSNEIYEGPTEERTVFDQEGADDKAEGLHVAPPRPPDVFPVRAASAGAAAGAASGGGARQLSRPRRAEQQVLAGHGRDVSRPMATQRGR